MPRTPFVLVESPQDPDDLVIRGGEARHLGRVLRACVGYRFNAFDGLGNGWLAEVVSVRKNAIHARIIDRLSLEHPTAINLSVAVGIVKGSRMDWAVEKAAELGVQHFIPLITRYSVVTPGSGRVERWKGIALSAAKQSGRFRLMEIVPPVEYEQFISESTKDGETWILDASDGSNSLQEMCTSLQTSSHLTLVFGPEGGFSEEELELARKNRIPFVKMQNHILRTETAVTAAVATIFNLVPIQPDEF